MGRVCAILKGAMLNCCRGRGEADRYERALRDYFGSADALVYWKGRVALYAMLRGLGVGPGDEVVMPGYTCVVVPNAVVYTGARPVYVDVNPRTYNAAAEHIEPALGQKTRAIIMQHSYGLPTRMEPILELARSRGLPVLEDCCHAFGSRYRGRLLGTFGAGSFFSGQWSKPFSTGLGGMAIVNDADLAERVRRLSEAECGPPGRLVSEVLAAELLAFHLLVFPRTIGLATRMFRWFGRHGLLVASSTTQEVEGGMPEGYFRRLSAGQAAVGLYELRRVEKNLAHRRRLAAVYDAALRDAGWPTPPAIEGAEPAMVRYPVLVGNKTELLALAEKHLVEMGDWFQCALHGAEVSLEQFGFDAARCPEAVRLCEQVVNLPLHLRVSERAARRAVEFLLRHGKRVAEATDG